MQYILINWTRGWAAHRVYYVKESQDDDIGERYEVLTSGHDERGGLTSWHSQGMIGRPRAISQSDEFYCVTQPVLFGMMMLNTIEVVETHDAPRRVRAYAKENGLEATGWSAKF